MRNRRLFFLAGSILVIAFSTAILGFFYGQKQSVAFWKNNDGHQENGALSVASATSKGKNKDIIKKVNIKSGETYADLMTGEGVSYSKAMKIYETAKPEYDLAKIKAGEYLYLTYTPNEKLKKIMYEIDNQDQLIIKNQKFCSATASTSVASNKWQTRVESIPYQTEVAVEKGRIESSMYKAAQKKDMDIRTIIKLAEAFQWNIDFAMEARKGDTFKLVYEKKYLDGEYVRPGKILAARYVNSGDKHEIFYYEESDDNKGYFTYEGESAQKMFLKAPVAYRYISSGYTQGPRYLAKFKMYTSSHRAVDYAAEIGTPIRAVGDGTIVTAGWNNSGYGYLTSVRHNSIYTTRYAHQSRISVQPGEKVEQGQVIGYVGSTGFSTGPHLHYEMWKNGAKVNPLDLELPASDSIDKDKLDDFHRFIKPYKEKLNKDI